MTPLLEFAAFALGAWLAIRMLAALHGAVDLWYDIAHTWTRVAGGIVFWEAVILGCLWLLDPPYETAFVWGFWIYLAFYLSVPLLLHLVVSRVRIDRRGD